MYMCHIFLFGDVPRRSKVLSSCNLRKQKNNEFVFQGGQWILDLVDHFGATFLVLFAAIAEITGVMWIYGNILSILICLQFCDKFCPVNVSMM